jgi:hypothetical protein
MKETLVRGIIDFTKDYRDSIIFNTSLYKKYEGLVEEISHISFDRDNKYLNEVADEQVYLANLMMRLSISRW